MAESKLLCANYVSYVPTTSLLNKCNVGGYRKNFNKAFDKRKEIVFFLQEQ